MILWIEWSIQSVLISKYHGILINVNTQRWSFDPLPDIFANISHTTEIFIYKKVNLLIVFYSKIYEILGRAFCIFP